MKVRRIWGGRPLALHAVSITTGDNGLAVRLGVMVFFGEADGGEVPGSDGARHC